MLDVTTACCLTIACKLPALYDRGSVTDLY